MQQARKTDHTTAIFFASALTFIAVALVMGLVPREQAAHGMTWMGLVMAVVLAGISALGGILFYFSNRTFDRRQGVHL